MTQKARLNGKRFAGGCDGNVAVTFGLLLTVILAVSGAAVDFGRWQMARSATMSALDAAVLAGGRALQLEPENTAGALAAARRYYDENVRNRIRLSDDSVDFIIADNQKSIAARGSAHIETTLLALAGFDRLPVVSNNAAEMPTARVSGGESAGSSIEVVLALDVTGSMCADGQGPCTSSTKLSGLKSSAKDLIDIVVWENQSSRTSRVAIVPFSNGIRVGPNAGGEARMKQLTNLDPKWTGWYRNCTSGSGSGGSEGAGNWTCNSYENVHYNNWKVMPCVTDRYYDASGYDYTDDAPGPGRWLNAHDGGRMTLSWDSSDAVPGHSRGQTPANPATHWNYRGDGICWISQPNNEVMALSADKAALKARIDGLEAYGGTGGALGTAWSWYMLSPKWNSIWTGSSAPGSYSDVTTVQASGAPLLRKVAVIMSDGVFNAFRGWKEQDQQVVSNHAKQLCTNMKAEGIEIYTVGFELDQLPTSEQDIAVDTLRSCGTDVQHFYNTLNVDQLKQAFRDIALEMSNVYLTR